MKKVLFSLVFIMTLSCSKKEETYTLERNYYQSVTKTETFEASNIYEAYSKGLKDFYIDSLTPSVYEDTITSFKVTNTLNNNVEFLISKDTIPHLQKEAFKHAQRAALLIEESINRVSITTLDEFVEYLSPLDGSLPALKELVKQNLHNPKSFKHVKTKVQNFDKNQFLVTMTYRGENGFGAIRTESILAIANRYGEIIKILE